MPLDTRPNNLPAQLTSFVGRERELGELQHLLTGEPGPPGTEACLRLVTLTGPGGCGKTRLALRVAADLLDTYPDGVWFVDLAPLTDGALVPYAVLGALAVSELPGRPHLATLTKHLRTRHLLLVLDNCEHLVEACAALADTLLRACPHLQVVATSRELLGVPGEATYRVPSLEVPPPGVVSPPEQLHEYAAVRLFVERARLVRPGFTVTVANAPAVIQVCHRLDGLPLAIELAAARVRVLTVEQIAARLDHRFHLLGGGSRTAVPRQQTLQATIDWSYDLLAAPERQVLRRLAVFVGGWTLDAAESVCAGEGVEGHEILDLLTGLVDKSLVVADDSNEANGEVRYRLLETVRQYAGVTLAAAGEEAAVRGRHRDWCLALAERAEPELDGPDQVEWLDRLEVERDNLRAALDWSHADPVGVEPELRLAAALGRFWRRRGSVGEGRRWLVAALGRCDSALTLAPAQALTLSWAGILAYMDGDYRASRRLLEQSVALSRRLDDARLLARALRHLAAVCGYAGDDRAAAAYLEEALPAARLAGDTVVAEVLADLGQAACVRGDFPAAERLLHDALAHARASGDLVPTAMALLFLGRLALACGEYATARGWLGEALAACRMVGDPIQGALVLLSGGDLERAEGRPNAALAQYREALVRLREGGLGGPVSLCLLRCAGMATMQGEAERAARLFGADDAWRTRLGISVSYHVRPYYEDDVAAARAALGDAAFAAAWAKGQTLTQEQAIVCALEDPFNAAPAPMREDVAAPAVARAHEHETGPQPVAVSIADAARVPGTALITERNVEATGALRVDTLTCEVWRDDRPLAHPLSPQEFALVAYLYAHQERVCTHRELGDAVWGAHAWDPAMLHNLVRRLNAKLAAAAGEPRPVLSIRGIGYRLMP